MMIIEFHFAPTNSITEQNHFAGGSDSTTDRNRNCTSPSNLKPDVNRYFSRFKVTTIPNKFVSNDTIKQAVANY